MTHCKPVFTLVLLALAISPLGLAQAVDALPSAPSPDPVSTRPSENAQFAPSKWYGVVDPGERIPPLYPRDKLMFWLHEEVGPASLAPAFLSAGYGQLRNGNPKYGSDSAGFGERLGAAALRDASMRFFSDSLLPTLMHSDPRYFRKGYGGVKARSGYALEQLFVHQRDSGARGFNYSDIFGRLAASGLAMTYYPQPSVSSSVLLRTWGTSLAGAEADNLFLEFWPDIRDAVFHRHNRSSAKSGRLKKF